jgi:hypothetical protein
MTILKHPLGMPVEQFNAGDLDGQTKSPQPLYVMAGCLGGSKEIKR